MVSCLRILWTVAIMLPVAPNNNNTNKNTIHSHKLSSLVMPCSSDINSWNRWTFALTVWECRCVSTTRAWREEASGRPAETMRGERWRYRRWLLCHNVFVRHNVSNDQGAMTTLVWAHIYLLDIVFVLLQHKVRLLCGATAGLHIVSMPIYLDHIFRHALCQASLH